MKVTTASGTSADSAGDDFTYLAGVLTTCSRFSHHALTNVGGTRIPTSVSFGDFNGDGRNDFAQLFSGSPAGISVWLGTATGSFAPANGGTALEGGTQAASITVGDLNADGRSEIVLANTGGNNLRINTANATASLFGSQTISAAGVISKPVSVAIGDFNGDGWADLAVANSDIASVSILLGTGAGNFGAPTNLAVGTTPSSIATGDFDGNGHVDLAVANKDSGNVSILIGNGSGAFAAATNFVVGTQPVSVAAADLNGDGRSDLAVANSGSNDVSILLATGTPALLGNATSLPMGAASGPAFVAVGDLNRDGRADLAVAKRTAGTVAILHGIGTGGFGTSVHVPNSMTEAPVWVAIGDFNGDNRIDLHIANSGDGTFEFAKGDDLAVEVISMLSATASTTEGASTLTINMNRTNTSGCDVSVDYTFTDGSAINGSDYIGANGTLTFAPNLSAAWITVPITNDILHEPDKTFSVTLSNPTNNARLGASTTTVATIVNDDPIPVLRINNISQAEGTGGTTNFDFTVTLTNATAQTVTAAYATANGQATSPGDYTATSGTLTFLPGTFTQTITVPVAGDAVNEEWENFVVTLSAATNAIIGTATGTGTIQNDDPFPTLDLSADVSKAEGTGGTTNFEFSVTLTGPTERTATVRYGTVNAGATAPSDYASTSGTLTFPPGTLTHTITVPVVADSLNEADQLFRVFITDAANATIDRPETSGTILNDDAAPTLAIDSIAQAEGTGGTSNFVFTVTLTGATEQNLLVNYGTVNGTAVASVDYTAASGILGFPAGTLTRTITVPIASDSWNEDDEEFTVHLSGAIIASITTPIGTGTIQNDDPAPVLTVTGTTRAEGTGGNPGFTFGVTLTGNTQRTVTADYTTSDGTATAPDDYLPESAGRLLFSGGVTIQTGKTIIVEVVGDAVNEPSETFTVNLSNAVNAVITTPQATGTIVDDDGVPTLLIDSVTQTEGTGGTTNLVFTVTLAGATSQPVTVNYGTTDGSATAPGDHAATSGMLTFPPGTLTQTITVPVVTDAVNEADESFSIQLSGATIATIAAGTGIGMIQNDDAPPALGIGDITATEGPALIFSVTLTGATEQTVTVGYTTASGSATAPADFATTSGTLTFPPGTLIQTIAVPIVADAVNEADETLTVDLSNASIATIMTASGTGTIVNDDAPPVLAIDDVTATEGAAFTFTVTLTGATEQAVTVDYATANGSATAPGDFATTSGTLTFPPGTLTQNITVPVVGDTVNEAEETFTVHLANPSIATITTASGTRTIVNDDGAPALAIHDITATEGTAFTFTVTLTGATEQTVTVDYATANASATAPGDYTASSGTLTFPAGSVTRTITVPVVADAVHEADETFTVALSGATVATIATSTGTATLQDDDAAPTLSIDDLTGAEGTDFHFTVTLTGATEQTATVHYATADATATSPADYAATSGTLTFPPGTNTQTVTVPVMGDTVNETNESFAVNLSGALHATIEKAQGPGTIVDDDGAPTLLINSVTRSEGSGTTTSLVFTVTLAGSTAQPVTVHYLTIDGTATAPDDYTAMSGTLTYAPGTLTQTIAVPVTADSFGEPDETFLVQLSEATVASITTAAGTGTVRNDDGSVPSLSIDSVSQFEGNSGTANLSFTVTLSPASSQTVTVHYAATDGTASAPGDYAATSGALTFGAGVTSATIPVAIAGDNTMEPNETFTLTLTNATNAVIGGAFGTGTILDDEGAASVSIAMTTSAPPFTAGNPISFEITVMNAGQNAATAVLVTDELPAGLTFVSASPTQGSCTGNPTVICTLGTIASGATARISVLALPATAGEVTNSAVLSIDPQINLLANTTASVSVTVLPAGIGDVPTVDEWAKLLLFLACAIIGIIVIRRR